MLRRIFAAASCALLILPSPALAQRMAVRVPSGPSAMPIGAPPALTMTVPAPALTLSAPVLAPGLFIPAPALAVSAAPAVARPAAAAAAVPALVSSLRPVAAAARRPDAPLDALRAAGESRALFDGAAAKPDGLEEPALPGASPDRRRGTLSHWNETRGYGFISPKDGGEKLFVVAKNIDQPTTDRKVLREGEEVEYQVQRTPEGPIAVKVIAVRLLPDAAAAHDDGEAAMLRPLVEGWRVGGKDYGSTRELVDGLGSVAAPVEATYLFAHSDKPLPPARAANTAVGFASGGALGALLGAAFFVFGSLVGPIMDLFLGGSGAGPALSELGLFAGFFGAAGALMGSFIAFEESGKPSDPRESIPGRLYRHAGPRGENLFFEANRNGAKVLVDLGKFADARPVVAPAAPAPWPLWKRAAAGLAAGAALAVSQWIPLLQILALPLAGPAAGAAVGRALTAGTGIAGAWLGGSLGLILPVAAFFSFAAVQSVGLLAAFGAFVAAVAGLGLVVGAFSANAVRADLALDAARNPAGQWWSSNR